MHMSNSLSIITLFAIALVLGCQQSVAQPTTFTLTSSDIGGQMTTTQVFDGFGCTGNNISPQLSWMNAPTETQSFAITMYDPDAPTGSGWWHWLVFNLPSDVTSLASGAGSTDGSALPARAIQSVTSFGTAGYGGPCPPVGHGLHRYVITVYALSVPELPLDSEANPALVGYNL
ncbi:MAG: YbhB/YbcL family Raf kinase inhibitor-like protein, partial [Bacteroidota bacterium]